MKLTTIMALAAFGAGAAFYTGSGAEKIPVEKSPANVSRASETMKSGDDFTRRLWRDTRERGRRLIQATLVAANEHPLER